MESLDESASQGHGDVIDTCLVEVRPGDDETEIAVPVLQVRLSVQGDLLVDGARKFKGQIHHAPANVEAAVVVVDDDSSDDDVVVVKDAKGSNRMPIDRGPHQDRGGFEFSSVQVRLSALLLPVEHGAAQPQAFVEGSGVHPRGVIVMKGDNAFSRVFPGDVGFISPRERRHHAPHLDRMSGMSTPRRAAPEDDDDLEDVARSWRRYLILVICGVVVAVLGLGIFGYLAWWSLCDQAADVCQRGEPVTYWCSVVALGVLGLIIGVLTQIWLEKRWWHLLAIIIPAALVIAGVICWFAV